MPPECIVELLRGRDIFQAKSMLNIPVAVVFTLPLDQPCTIHFLFDDIPLDDFALIFEFGHH